MRVVSYNIQYGKGLDGEYDVKRICDAIRDADVICLQEVTRGYIANGGADMVAAIEAEFPSHFSSYHPVMDIDMLSGLTDGKAVNRRLQFGNMVLSRYPIVAVRGHLLPRTFREGQVNLQRGALEALINAPDGPLRVYSVHLDHVDPAERLKQVHTLKQIAFGYGETGGAISGGSTFGLPGELDDGSFLLLGDFNFNPASAEYAAMVDEGEELIDVSSGDTGWSWVLPSDLTKTDRIDHIFANPELAPRCSAPMIDREAKGSDHMPVWLTITA